VGQNDVSVLASSKVTWGVAGTYYGIDFALVNLETNTLYYSKQLSTLKQRHSIIENIPAGKYRIFYFGGSQALQTTSNKIHEYFGVLEFETSKSYYLGNFVGRREIGTNEPIVYTVKELEIPEELIKYLLKKQIIGSDEELIKTYPYKADSLIIQLGSQSK
jgi:hypothetical protein